MSCWTLWWMNQLLFDCALHAGTPFIPLWRPSTRCAAAHGNRIPWNATSNACAITKSSNLKWIRWCCVAIISIAVRCTASNNNTTHHLVLGLSQKQDHPTHLHIEYIWRCGESQAWQAHARTTFVSGYRFMNEN